MSVNNIGVEASGLSGSGVGKPEIGPSPGPGEYDGIDIRDRLETERYHFDLMSSLTRDHVPIVAHESNPPSQK